MFYAYILLLPLIVFSTNDVFLTCCAKRSLSLSVNKEKEGGSDQITNGDNTTVGHTATQSQFHVQNDGESWNGEAKDKIVVENWSFQTSEP